VPAPPRRVVWIAAVVGLSADLIIALTTVLPDAPLLPQWPEFAVFPFLFVVHLRTVLVFRGRKAGFREMFDPLPRPIYLACGALFVGAWVVTLWSITHLRGQPEQHGGAYFLDDHGSLIPVSHAAYRHALVLQQRIFSLIPGVFFGVGVLAHRARGR
jgi:hypothetical protein